MSSIREGTSRGPLFLARPLTFLMTPIFLISSISAQYQPNISPTRSRDQQNRLGLENAAGSITHPVFRALTPRILRFPPRAARTGRGWLRRFSGAVEVV